jgi:hypothetical protein
MIAVAQDEKAASTAEKTSDDKDLAADMKLMQGTWELFHGNEGRGRPTSRAVKTIEGNKETFRRFSLETGKMTHEHSQELQLTKSGDIRVCTFYRVGGSPDDGMSFVYKVDEENFWDIPGMLQGDEYRNYQQTPTIWHWKRVTEEKEQKETDKK